MFKMFKVVVIVCVFLAASAEIDPKRIRGVQIKNRGPERLWIEMTDEDSFDLPAGQTASVLLDYSWSGNISGRAEDCQHKKCDSPRTIARLIFGGEKGEDHYHVSIADGFNRPMKIVATGPNNFCKPAVCTANINDECPPSHQIKDEDDKVIACKPVVKLFQKLCPQAVAAEQDYMNNISCKTSNTYFVSLW